VIVGDPIRAAQQELGLTHRDALFATLLGIEASALRHAAEGDSAAREEVLRRAALVLGIEAHELLFEGAEGRASTALFKAVVDPLHASAFEEAAHQGLQQALGRFVRRLRRKAWLRAALGLPAPELPHEVAALARSTPPEKEAPFGADTLAARVREALGLGDAPIPRMVSLVHEGLQIEVHVTRTMWTQIDGASYAQGVARGILVNLHDRARPRSVRMTLAHELCHVLFDGDFAGAARGGMLAFSPGGERSRPVRNGPAYPAEAFQLREQRANAFAAYLIAPPRGVRSLLGDDAPPVYRTVHAVAEHFGLSRVTALNVAANVYGWSKDERLSLLESFEGERPLDDAPWRTDGLTGWSVEDAELRDLADRAVAGRRLLPAERDRYVGE